MPTDRKRSGYKGRRFAFGYNFAGGGGEWDAGSGREGGVACYAADPYADRGIRWELVGLRRENEALCGHVYQLNRGGTAGVRSG